MHYVQLPQQAVQRKNAVVVRSKTSNELFFDRNIVLDHQGALLSWWVCIAVRSHSHISFGVVSRHEASYFYVNTEMRPPNKSVDLGGDSESSLWIPPPF